MKIWMLGLLLCAVACGGGNGGSSKPEAICHADDAVLDCFDAVIVERNECWKASAYRFTDYSEEFFYYYDQLELRDPESFYDCAAIQDDFQLCVRATDEQFYSCTEVSDALFFGCLDPAVVSRSGCYSDVFSSPEFELCQMVGGKDCAFHALLECDRAFSVLAEGCLGDADYAEQDCLTDATDALVCP